MGLSWVVSIAVLSGSCWPIESQGTTNLTMKPLAPLLLTLFFPALIRAEEPAPPASVGTYIPDSLEVSTFTPPPPVVPKVPLTDAEATLVVRDDGGLTTTLQRGQASMAPDLTLPEPVAESPSPQLYRWFRDPTSSMSVPSRRIFTQMTTIKNTVHVKLVNCQCGAFFRAPCWNSGEITFLKAVLKNRYAQTGIKLTFSEAAGPWISANGWLDPGEFPIGVVCGVLEIPQVT